MENFYRCKIKENALNWEMRFKFCSQFFNDVDVCHRVSFFHIIW